MKLRCSIFIQIAALLLMSVAPLNAQQATEPRLALVMGVGDYRGTKFPTLPGIDQDLKRMESALKATGFQVTVVANPTLGAAEEAIETFGARLKAQAGGVGLFYFSGHGGEFEGKNYLIPKGARVGGIRDIKEEAVAAQRVLNRMEDAGARVNIVFLDCCRNDLTKAATASGLAPMSARGTFIGFATGTDKTSLAGTEGSPYTTFLAKRLLTPGVSILDMHTQVTADVEDYTKANGVAEQTPFQYCGLRSGFFFVPGQARSVDVEAEIQRRVQVEMAKLASAASRAAPAPVDSPVTKELAAATKSKPFVNSLGQEFVPVPGTKVLFCRTDVRVRDFRQYASETGFRQIGGAYLIKVNKDEKGRYSMASELDRQATWEQPGFEQSAEDPVVCVSWNEAYDFCTWLSKKEGRTYRLPTDAEWSAAVGAGKYPWGNLWPPPSGVGNYMDEALVKTLPGKGWSQVPGNEGYPRGLRRWEGSGRTGWGCTIWEAMCGNGARKSIGRA